MKKKLSEEKVCESRTEYDLKSLLPGGVQGKYAALKKANRLAIADAPPLRPHDVVRQEQ